MNFTYSQCRGIISLANFTQDKSSSCFGVIMDLDFWCVIVRLTKNEESEAFSLDLEELKMVSFNLDASTIDLQLISK